MPTITFKELKIHKAVSNDGTKIAGRICGEGPPLVLLPAGPGDSETSWLHILPYLSKNFTCYLLNTRGRGLSENHPDHSPERLAEDVISFAESIGEPVALVEWGTVLWTLVAAQNNPAISAVVAYEPGVDEVMSNETGTHFAGIFESVGNMVVDGRLDDAAKTFIKNSNFIYTEEELAHGAPKDFWLASAPNLPVFFQEQQLLAKTGQLGPADPWVLERISVPVLLLHGNMSRQWFTDSVGYINRHIETSNVREISGAAHFAPWIKPEAVANEIAGVFKNVP